MNRKIKETIDIQDAMDNLAAIAGIDLANPPPLGVVNRVRIVTTAEDFGPEVAEWLSEEGTGVIVEVLDLTYRSILHHLRKMYQDPGMNWGSEKVRKGIASMMDLVGESPKKMERYFALRLGSAVSSDLVEREEYKALQKFYTRQFVHKFPVPIEGAASWDLEWEENSSTVLLDATHTGLKDFETVRRDLEYELFYIRNENGEPYFNAELLRNIRLSCDFDLNGESFEEDPLLKVRAMQDRDLHATAGQILGECHGPIIDYYKISHKVEGNELGQSLGMAILALFLAANPRYLIQNTVGKSCQQYFIDFHRFLRRAMRSTEYQKLIAYPPDKTDKISHLLLYLTHALARGLFERVGGIRREAIGLIHRAMRRGEEIKQKGKEKLLRAETLWTHFLLDDEKLRTLLSQFPNGPLFKVLDLVREEKEENAIIAFDPIGQENFPSRVYELRMKGKKIDVLRIPSPTRQSLIHRAEVVPEFCAFLRAVPSAAHLMINLQDRTSWKEYARSHTLETLQLNAEFSHQLYVLTLPKYTDFYYQINEYQNLNAASEFIQALKEQLFSGESCGFFFPSQIKMAEMVHFADGVIAAIHQHFFHGNKQLTRQNREDFIEIFYQFLILKCIETLKPTSLSFTCKDAIDTGSAELAIFYGFITLLNSDFSDREDVEFLRWLLYAPALFIRERAIDPERLHRFLSVLERLDKELKEHHATILKVFEKSFGSQFLKSLEVKTM